MDLDEMKNQVKRVKAPAIDDPAAGVRSVNNLIAALKTEDAMDKKKYRKTMVFFAIAGVFYAGLFVLTWIAPPDDSPNVHRTILGLFALVFLSLGVYGRAKSNELSGIDYAASSRAFLKSAEKRYRIVPLKEIVFIVILAMTSAVALLNALERYFFSLDLTGKIIVGSAYFLIVLAAAPLRWLEWKKRKGPLLKEIREKQAKLARQEVAGDEGI
jgi:hypothetical protein